MSTENFKEQQNDRVEEGKELLREDEIRDLSQIPTKQLPGADNRSLLTKIGEGVSNAAYTISDKVGISAGPVEGHEDLDRDVRKQVKKINKEILKQAAEKGPEVEKKNEWEQALPKVVKNEGEETAETNSKNEEKTSFADKVKGGVQGLSESISQGIDGIKQKFTKEKESSEVEKKNEWEQALPKVVKKEVEEVTQSVTSSKTEEKTPSLVEKVKGSVQGLSENISQGVNGIKQKLTKEKEEESNDDGTKHYKTVKDGIKENVNDLKHEQRVAELGQEELSSKNPFQPLTSGNNEEGENRTLGEKIKGGLNDASQKISSTVGGVSEKVKSTFVHKETNAQDKENAQQVV